MPQHTHSLRAIMTRPFLVVTLMASTLTLFAQAGELYFQKDSTIVRCSEDQNTLDTVWRAPFMIQDVSMSRDCNFICFTKSAVADESRPEREVGYYSLLDGKITIVKSNTKFNFGALISPSNALIAFSYLPGEGAWKTALYDRIKRTILYDVAPSIAGDSYCAFGWESDSLLLFQTLDNVIAYNLYKHSNKIFTPPDTEMEFSVPGTQMLFLNDSALAFMCEDGGRSMFEEFEGPPSNVFICSGGKTTRLFTGKEDVSTCLFSRGNLYIGYADYAQSKQGKDMLIRFDIVNNKKYFLTPVGTLVGIKD